MNSKLLIFDGNHLAYRAYYKFMNLKTIDGVMTSLVYGMPYVAESLIRRVRPNKVIMTFDGGRSKFRMGLLPNYKNREKKLGFDAEDFYRQRDIARDIFMAMGIEVVCLSGYEADDLIGMITRRYSMKEWDVIIVSADKDFDQLIMENFPGYHGRVTVLNTKSNIELDCLNLKKTKGILPHQVVDYLSLLGDTSDKIPGYPGIGPKKALKILNEYNGIQEFIQSDENFGKIDKVELKRIWQLNKKLIDIKYYYRKFLRKMVIPSINPNPKFDMASVKKLCSQNEINTFLKPQFINTFKKLMNE